MKENLTQIIFILDRSGSMQDLTTDTIGGFNSFVEKQKLEPGEALLTTILFDDKYEILHDGENLKNIKELTTKEYSARGTTALLDAMGKTINTVGEKLSKMEEKNRPSKVILVVTTDGMENSSKEFSREKIKEMVEHQTNKYQWQFIFLGANMDAVAVGQMYGFTKSATYTANDVGTRSLYATLNTVTASYRSDGTVNEDWDKDIQ
jgi:uncharacterized protein YegL